MVGVASGMAELDIDGDDGGAPESPAELAALGIDDAERTQLAQLYSGPPKVRAASMASDLRTYLGTGWPLDRARGEPMQATPRRTLLFRICALDPDRGPPLGITRLTEIIGG